MSIVQKNHSRSRWTAIITFKEKQLPGIICLTRHPVLSRAWRGHQIQLEYYIRHTEYIQRTVHGFQKQSKLQHQSQLETRTLSGVFLSSMQFDAVKILRHSSHPRTQFRIQFSAIECDMKHCNNMSLCVNLT